MREDDALMAMLNDVRKSRPPIYLADEWRTYMHAVAQCILAMPTETRQWSASVLVASDIMKATPGLMMDMAYAVVQEAVQQAAVTTRR